MDSGFFSRPPVSPAGFQASFLDGRMQIMAPSPSLVIAVRELEPYSEPLSGMIVSVILSMLSLAIISSFLSEQKSPLSRRLDNPTSHILTAVPDHSTEGLGCESMEKAPLGAVAYVFLAVSRLGISSLLTLARKTVVFAIYADSWLFVFATAILQFGLGVDESISVCESAILLCLVCYVTTKVQDIARFK